MREVSFRAMGCEMRAVVDAESSRAAGRLAQVPTWFSGWERALSRFRQDSEVNRLNRRAGQWTYVSTTLWEVTRLALGAARQSDGLIDPTLLNELEAAGYDRTFDQLHDRDAASSRVPRRDAPSAAAWEAAGGSRPHPYAGGLERRPRSRTSGGPDEGRRTKDEGGFVLRPSSIVPHQHDVTDAQAARPALALEGDPRREPGSDGAAPAGNWYHVGCGQSARAIRLPAGVRLDLGGVAKGWAADRVVQRLGPFGPALVDAGGDIGVSGPPADQPGWPVGVADPRAPGKLLALLNLRHGGVATSGRDYRRWRRGGAWQHHILDPRTGRPAETDVLSATVIAPSASEADVAAKIVLILGSRAGLAWLEARPSMAALLVCEDGRVLESRRLPGHLWS